jgi:hypothetical protein
MQGMTRTTQIAARMPTEVVAEIDRSAAEDSRTRSGQLAWLTRLGLAGRARLAELERLAASTVTKIAPRANTAAADHLAAHAALAGLDQSETHE